MAVQISRGIVMLALCVLCALLSPAACVRLKHSASRRALARHISHVVDRGKPKGGKKNKGAGKDKHKAKRGKLEYPSITLDTLAAHDLDAEEARLMTEMYMRKQVPGSKGEALRCCCRLEASGDVGDVSCKILRGAELGSSWNPFNWAGSVCPAPYLDWDSEADLPGMTKNSTKEKWPLEKFPTSCRESNLNEVLRDLVPDQRRTHEAMIIAESTLRDAIGPEVLEGVSEKCCCPIGKAPTDCAIMTADELVNGSCPTASGQASWDSAEHGFELEEMPEVCRGDDVDAYMRQVPRDFAITALVASAATFETRYALDPVASASLHANAEAVRRRLEEVMKLLDESLDAVRKRWEVVRNRGAWIFAEFIYAILGGTIQRALRLLTPAQIGQVEDVVASESSANLAWAALEKDSELMREFVASDYLDPDKEYCVKLKTVSPGLSSAILKAALLENFDDECDLVKIQETLRGKGAWWQTKIKGEPLMELFFPEKTDYVIWWTKMRAALDFSPWPVAAKETRMVVPTICESDYLIGGETARYPKYIPRYGGKPIMHTFMVFAGGEPEKYPGCLDVLMRLAELFPNLPARGESSPVLKEYREELEKADRRGCQGMVPLGRVWLEVRKAIDKEFKKVESWTFELEYANTQQKAEFEVRKGVATKKNKSSKRKKFASLEGGLLKWLSHTMVKKTAQSIDDDWARSVEGSLRKTPPSIPAHEISADFNEQLTAQGIPSPYDDEHCPDVEAKECGDWDNKASVYWEAAQLTGASLEVAIEAVKVAHKVTRPGDWALLAQTPAAYGAAGFDSPGTGDNSDWKCDKRTESCNVHPRCARAAAQMLSSSFMKKRYAANWTSKIFTAVSGYLGTFDDQGWHDYCHSYEDAYCWSYTGCLKEMMKWLCHEDDTAAQCCPNAQVRHACKANVNGPGCKICEEIPENATVPQYIVPEIAEETLAWLRPGLEEAAQAQCTLCDKIRGMNAKDPPWLWIEVLEDCKGKKDKCLEICGITEKESIDDMFAACKGWEARCYDMGCTE